VVGAAAKVEGEEVAAHLLPRPGRAGQVPVKKARAVYTIKQRD
jgi:hypothetical protein